MAQTKNQLIRQQVIDRCLKSGNFSVKMMMEKCKNALEAAGYKPVTSKVTILKDIEGIKDDFPDAKIVTKRAGHDVFYEYEDKSFSIYKIPLSDNEMAQLAQTVSMLSRFEGLPNFDWVDDLIERFKSSLNIPSTRETIVAFDENFDLKGRNWFAQLFSAIASQKALEIKYQPFDRPVNTYLFHPYLLKQYNNRWFLFGCVDGYTSPTNFPLDRIQEIGPASIPYKPNPGIDFFEYFEDMVGVSRRSDEVTKIQMKVDNWRYHYIETKPLHGTQRVIRRDDDGVVIQIEVIINPELLQLLLSYGSSITVLEPQELQQAIYEESIKISQKYQSVHLN